MEKHLSEFIKTKNQNKDPLITSLEYDSRKVKQGSLFFAIPGIHTDGSLFIEDAISKGAGAIVHQCENIKALEEKYKDIVFIKTQNAQTAMSPAAASFYDNPSHDLYTIGVTGTDGKSTTVFLIWQLLTMLGKKAGFYSTVQHSTGGEILLNEEHKTTPEALEVQKLLRDMINESCEYAVIEASSHGLSPKTGRLGDVNFCAAVLTNITHEHLEFHGTFEQYREDKANLFRALDRYVPSLKNGASLYSGAFGVINGDDRNARFFAKTTNQKVFMYSAAGRDGDIIVEAIKSSNTGNWYVIHIPAVKERIEIRDKLPGVYNSGNVLAAILTVSNLLQLPVREIAPLVKKLKPVPGRMTPINKGQNFSVFVDYGHTPSALWAVMAPLREKADRKGVKIISVFGASGERDTQKRQMMGNAAANFCDIIILSDDDPRSEDSLSIMEEIAKGIAHNENNRQFTRDKNLFFISDRLSAVKKALSFAGEGDYVLFMGKGHEKTMLYKDNEVPYDEIAEVGKALSELKCKI